MNAVTQPFVPPDVAIAPDQPNRRALILPGGGMRVAYQAGAVQALMDAGLRFSIADAASGGIMNLAALLSGVTPDGLCARWRTLDVTAFMSPRSLSHYLRFPNIGAFGDFDGIKGRVFPHLGIDIDKIRTVRSVRGTFNVCNFDDKVVVPLPHSDLKLDLLLAGISLPLVTPAVVHGGRTYTDAVWIRDCNLMAAVRNGADELWVIWCIGNTPHFEDDLFKQYVHMIEMSALGALHADLARIKALNERIRAGETPYGHTRPIVVHLVEPAVPLPLDPDYMAGKIDGATLVDSGYRDASRYLATGSEAGIALEPASTKMRLPGRGLAFRETMTGRLTLGVTDPKAGYDDPAAIPFRLHASIGIDDTAGFVADPSHKGGLVGNLTSPRFGGLFPASRGVFGLFTPSGDPKTTWMVYEMGFVKEGKPYWFSGRKHVEIASPFRAWRATTTLHVTLHEGEDAGGAIIGAGILRLGIFDLIALLGTLHATGCRGIGERWRSLAGFAGFFARELIRTYLLRRPVG